MQSTFKLLSAAAVALTANAGELKPGACPARDQNKSADNFNRYSMAGLWYEYVWDKEFGESYDYKCSTWIVLNDENENGDGAYVIYNNMINKTHTDYEDSSANDFIKFRFMWDQPTDAGQKARGTFRRQDDQDEQGTAPNSALQFIDTDYHSYVVGSQCIELGDQHQENFFVWTREKQPSMFMRKRARNAVLALGLESESLVKGQAVECWGKDLIM